MARTSKKCLFLESASDYRIILQVGKADAAISLNGARKMWEAGEADDWNMAFDRLVKMNWDLDAVKEYYQSKKVPA
jgi:hypothetical protein